MFAARQKSRGVLSKAAALSVCLVLVLEMGAALVHVTLVRHIWCENHHAFEHADATDAAVHDDGRAHTVDPKKHPPARGRGRSDRSCPMLVMLHGPSVPVPQIGAALLNLPPPSPVAIVRPIDVRTHVPSPIEILRFSPGLSPPVITA